ncbi:hypothetical protein JNO42_08630 [Pseudomonas putida]|uniref:hypothetical protein n=1 Tax=Pseudomonas putida TaxID=303 RepID=UPI001EF77692|nr:hypothetical protein [Pseudomonas putida]ULL07063.1 hypothetical protein JNO42_08630 [Pseudomonas putida]
MPNEQSVKYQAALLGDFSKVLPTEDIIKSCIGSFFGLGLLPNGNNQEFDQRTNKLEPRLGLQSMRNGIQVNFLAGRADIIVSPLPGSPSATLTLETFLEQAQEITKIILELFQPKINRLGFVHEKFCEPMTKERLEVLRKKFISPGMDIFTDNPMSEWNVRTCSLVEFGGVVNQPVNLIHALNRVKVQQADPTGFKEYDSIHVMIDVNTGAEREIACSPDLIQDFFSQALAQERTVNKRLSEVIYG